MKAGLLIAGILLVSLLIAGFIILGNSQRIPSRTSSQKTLEAKSSQYIDPTYHFGFIYPTTYHLQKTSTRIILSPQDRSEKKLIGEIITSPIQTNSPRQALLKLCHDTIFANCLIDSQSIFITTTGVTGSDYYFKTASKAADLTTVLYGPVYLFTLPLSERIKKILLFYPETLTATDSEKEDYKTILKSLTLPTPPPQGVPTRVSTSGAYLSPSNSSSSSAKKMVRQ